MHNEAHTRTMRETGLGGDAINGEYKLQTIRLLFKHVRSSVSIIEDHSTPLVPDLQNAFANLRPEARNGRPRTLHGGAIVERILERLRWHRFPRFPW